jgi:putative ABC transport system substrate-binding protein
LVEYRWGSGDAERIRKSAAELVALAPDVILVSGNSGLVPLHRETRTLPIVFVNASDPVGGGFAASLARPGGNVTGFASIEYGMSGKWLELLKQISPGVSRAAVVRDPSIPSGSGQFGAIQAVGPFLGVEINPIDARDAGEIERGITELGRSANGGLIVPASTPAIFHRKLIIALAARHRLPAIYPYRFFVADGAWSPMAPIRSTRSAALPATSIASSRARSPRTCPCRRRPSTSWRSTSRPRKRWVSTCQRRCSRAPTR